MVKPLIGHLICASYCCDTLFHFECLDFFIHKTRPLRQIMFLIFFSSSISSFMVALIIQEYNLQSLKFQTSYWIRVANIWQRRVLSRLSISYCENFVLSLKCLFYPKASGTIQHNTSVSGKIQHLEIQLSLDQILASLPLKQVVSLSVMIPPVEGKEPLKLPTYTIRS